VQLKAMALSGMAVSVTAGVTATACEAFGYGGARYLRPACSTIVVTAAGRVSR
jgi:hypothetical protein